MKNILALSLCLALPVLMSGCAFGQVAESHTWTVTLKVVDDDGNPVKGAEAAIAYPVPWPPGKIPQEGEESSSQVKGLTDTSGIFVATHSSQPGFLSFLLGIRIQKEGYYSTWIQHDFGPGYDKAKWNPTLTLALKKVGKPIAMYAKRLNTHVPALDKPIGFDLMVGDWIAPYGKGINTDIFFTGHFDKKADGESDFTLTVSFPNHGDGIQSFAVTEMDKAGGLLSPHEAPADGYQPQWVQTDNRKPNKPIETNRDANRNYFFRVRTKLNESGNVVSTYYGKIYGDFMEFTYYLNPTPNDRNIEFDPKQNLLSLKFEELKVTAP